MKKIMRLKVRKVYKVLLVDDEIMIREAISESIDWNGLGFELIGSCANGKKAVEMISQEVPDLILTDICMPFMDGLELSKYVFENYPQIKIAIISGYDNFDYAKKAIQYRVMEYILKPITARELTDTLVSILERIQKEEKETAQIDQIKSAYEKSKPVLKERFLNQLIRGGNIYRDLGVRMESYGITLPGDTYAVARILCRSSFEFTDRHPEIRDEIVLFAVYNVVAEMMIDESDCVVFQDAEDAVILLVAGESGYQVERRLVSIYVEIKEFVASRLRIETVMFAGKCVIDLQELPQSYENAKAVYNYEFLFDDHAIIFGRYLEENRSDTAIDIANWTERILSAMKQCNYELVCSVIRRFMELFRDNYVEKSKVITYVQSVIMKIVMAVTDGIENGQISEREKEFLLKLQSFQKLHELEMDLIAFCEGLMRLDECHKDETLKQPAEKALEYIERNYSNWEVSLNSVCTYMSMSTSYFSTMFKSYTGETFIEALTKKRMEKAKELLETTKLKAYEIAGEVGYNDPHYFGSTFKKYTGMTPTEYAKKRR